MDVLGNWRTHSKCWTLRSPTTQQILAIFVCLYGKKAIDTGEHLERDEEGSKHNRSDKGDNDKANFGGHLIGPSQELRGGRGPGQGCGNFERAMELLNVDELLSRERGELVM